MTTELGRPRLTLGLIVLLVIITAANLFALAAAVMLWHDEATYGGDLQGLAVFSTLLTSTALVGVAGAWWRRTWGPPLYFGAQATGFLLVLFAAPAAIGPLTFVPLLLAGLLWLLAG